ncbi:histone acetyltransferase HPA2 and related acetyltransferases [Candidatus Scalindua japonica]|uniref:Histone acetyltransferase HPA2 and related acetyltransferases n=1 Tax=Candidatus Scalindua japonica TaxID=1284222 RepID=A0A286U1I7_9BACT|nr:hypothetical protein [Candidatus Scalindua japonica]GAX61931.1 histone acetyltransferase HPA2 and related acetyltransferases [Candidatus Scalindua japonica]
MKDYWQIACPKDRSGGYELALKEKRFTAPRTKGAEDKEARKTQREDVREI